jgi:mRNA-degrading endonuclease toxin of MazEF toxin-antitoxin module
MTFVLVVIILGGVRKMGYKEDLVNWAEDKYKLHQLAQNKPVQQMQIKRGEIYWAVLGKNVGSEQNERRPVLIIQNNNGNRFGNTTIIAPITDPDKKRPKPLPTEVKICLREQDTTLGADPAATNTLLTGVIRLQQIRVLSKARLEKMICDLNDPKLAVLNPKVVEIMPKVRKAALISMEL